MGVCFSGQVPRGLTWLLRPHRGLMHSAKATQYCRTKTRGKGIITTQYAQVRNECK